MNYRIVTHRDAAGGHVVERAYIFDEIAGKIVAEVVQIDGCRPLVELANRAAAEAVEEAKKRTEGTARCAECGHPYGSALCQKAHP